MNCCDSSAQAKTSIFVPDKQFLRSESGVQQPYVSVSLTSFDK